LVNLACKSAGKQLGHVNGALAAIMPSDITALTTEITVSVNKKQTI